EFQFSLLQCRPLRQHEAEMIRPIPKNVQDTDKIFTANKQVPEGVVERIRYIVYVRPDAYHALADVQQRHEIGRVVGRMNERLKDEEFILMGPGRWGTSDINLGVKVSYADIYNTRALIEIAYSNDSGNPEMAYGTHFFQDLVEAEIFPLALFPDDADTCYAWSFFDDAPNMLADLRPEDADWAHVVTVIDVAAYTGGRLLELVMDADADQALGYLKRY
ncbi:MAG: pyruvate, phosphate dikinase, partial [Anaerolineae bacterium]|nr:pyruvate, phosphate dikinase [Anaerolineae bacterium]